MIAINHSMVAILQHPGSHGIVIRNNQSPVTHHIERFERMHAKRIDLAETSRMPAVDVCSHSGTSILNYRPSVGIGDFDDSLHLRRCSSPMHWKDCFHPGVSHRLDQTRVDLKPVIAVDEHRTGSYCGDGAYGCVEGVSYSDDLVSGADPRRLQG